jgi:hypothetical protein
MRLFYRVSIVLILFLGACGGTSALETQNRPHNSRQARLYFIRQPAILSKLGSADIKIDGALVGSLGASAYIEVDRPPGPHTISVFGPILDSAGFEADIKLEPGVSYYFELGPIVRMNADLLSRSMMVTTGHPIRGRFNATSVYMFYSLDAAAAATSVAKLRDRP